MAPAENGSPSATGPSREALLGMLKEMSKEVRELDVGYHVARVPHLGALEFLRDFVGPNKPVLLTQAAAHWPAHKKWSDEYLLEAVGAAQVTVALTPNGRADAVTPQPLQPSAAEPDSGGAGEGAGGDCFALPAQQRMSFREFVQLFYASKGGSEGSGGSDKGREGGRGGAQQGERQQQAAEVGGGPSQRPRTQLRVVPYLQFQNSSLTAELPQLLDDVDEHFPWATEAFGSLPEAINIWWGDERSVTSWHKDPMENLYIVVSGEKTFTLLPPSEAYRMRLRNYPLATYAPCNAGGQVGDGCVAGGTTAAGAKSRPGGAEAAAAAPSQAASGGGSSSSSSGGLVPVLHEPRQEVLWSSVQPEHGWRAGWLGSSSGTGTGCGGGGGGGGGSEGFSGGAAGAAGGCSGSWGRGGAAGSTAPDCSSWAGDLFAGAPGLPAPIRVTVRPGELIYLPALWYHQVEQRADETGRVIAVNYWYDMRFDARHAHYKLVENLAEALGLNERPSTASSAAAVMSDGESQ